MDSIKLQSLDGKIFEVDEMTVRQSVTIKTMLDTLKPTTNNQDKTIEPILLSTIKGKTLKKILKWCEYHKYDEIDEEFDREDDWRDNYKVNNDWNKHFLQSLSRDALFEIVIAANYLDIQSLYNAGCKIISVMIEDKSPRAIQKLFGIKADLTEAEVERIKAENRWFSMN